MIVASAPAKAILFGEHFVVYGVPAIVVAIELRARAFLEPRHDGVVHVKAPGLGLEGSFEPDGSFTPLEGGPDAEKALRPVFKALEVVKQALGAGRSLGADLEIRSEVPVAAGLGSSAAVAVASSGGFLWSLKGKLDKQLIFEASLEAEKLVHVSPSGVDPAISTYGGVVLYEKGKGIRKLDLRCPLELVIGDTGIKRSTGALVSAVRELRDRRPVLFSRLLESARELVLEALDALRSGDLMALGDLMNINHGLLSAIGVSNMALEKLVHAAREAGALGAKLTGAGGGGCMIALVEEGRGADVAKAVEKAGGKAFRAGISEEGIRIERPRGA